MSAPANARPLSATRCSSDGQFKIPPDADGCMAVVGSGLHVDTVKAGVTHVPPFSGLACGYFKVGVIPPGGTISTIHTSAYSCVGDQNALNYIYWGPTYTQNKDYANGTTICGWFSAWYQEKGCVNITA